ncbi:hypothetical protein J7E93_09330 [Streptomyces sp. ISL-36]|uniref:hypothetical protein n=1 Tax=Streptomyces sp. ISL-36 TaxID=2819182 RepID=UPI001BEA0351|nr:hypothetical protein [Streptomyces sp. ISL-36]MBT2440307.1 hypothetical protein [Streptomyces sp. ISL-36]
MADDLQFSWELSGSGWATYRIADGASEHKGVVSYCTDALADLLNAVTGIYGDSTDQRVSFDLEPAELRWRLRRREADVTIAIYRFLDMTTSWDAPDDTGTLFWSSKQPRSVLGHVMMETVETVLQLHGETGYREKWVLHPFPVAALQELRRLHRRGDDCRHEQCWDSPEY